MRGTTRGVASLVSTCLCGFVTSDQLVGWPSFAAPRPTHTVIRLK